MDPVDSAAAAALQANHANQALPPALCPLCGFQAVNYVQMNSHALSHLASVQAQPASVQAQPTTVSVRKPKPFKRPSMGMPTDWANFLGAWERYRICTNIHPNKNVIEFIQCLTEELWMATTHAFPNLVTLDLNTVVRYFKSTAVIPVFICIRRSNALSSRQKLG